MAGPVRPSGYFGWASATGVTNIVEPPDSTKQMGWPNAATPPSAYENWLRQRQDQALAYLQWKSEMVPLLEDEFVNVASYFGGPNGSTQWVGGASGYLLGSKWILQAYNPISGNFQFDNAVSAGYGPFDDPRKIGRNGIVSVNALNGWAELKGRVGDLNGRDFRMELIYNELCRGAGSGLGQSGYSFDIGLYQSSGVASGSAYAGTVSKFLTFGWTGQSGLLCVNITPTGLGQTSISLGVAPPFQQWAKLSVEARSPTMAFYLNDVLVGAAPFVNIGASGQPAWLGMRGGIGIGYPTGGSWFVDSLRIDARRAPT